jgi:aminomethyltransferase
MTVIDPRAGESVMTAATELHRTPLYEFHKAQGGKLVDFAGWEMPLTYAWPAGGGGIRDEHEQVRTSGGFFDVSHMGRVAIKGRHARRLVERLVTRRVSDMQHGQCRYALCLNEDGGVKDDVLVYRLDDDDFLIVCNAANREKLLGHFVEVQHAGGREGGPFSCKIDDRTFKTAMVAVQGPRVMDVVSKVSSEVPTLKKYRFVEKNLLIMKLMVSRTGYTGEDGVEVILPAKAVTQALKMLLKDADGADAVIKPAGLGARDTLRLEAGMALYGNELTEDIDALATGLGFAMNLDKDEDERGESFIGLDALKRIQAEGGPKRKLVGLKIEGKRTARSHMPITAGDDEVGEVTSGCMSPTLGEAIALAYVDAERSEVGTALAVDAGKGRSMEAVVVKPPFYKASK